MSMLQVEVDALGRSVELYYEDIGYGFPVVFVHGSPFDHTMWEDQTTALIGNGCRVITYDRRGFGRSCRTQGGYNYNRFADDLGALLEALNLRDVTLVGYSSGVGDVIRYMGRHLGQRVGRVALISSIAPSILRSPSNPSGLEDLTLHRMASDIRADRFEYASHFINERLFQGTSANVSRALKDWLHAQLYGSSTEAVLASLQALEESDFTDELNAIVNLPTLIVHGDADAIAPIEATGKRLAETLPNSLFHTYKGGSHGLFATHGAKLSADILELVRTPPNMTLPVAAA